MALINLFVDRQNQILVVSDKNGSPYSIPALYQSNKQPFSVTVLDPTGQIATPFFKVNLGSYGLRLAIGDTPAGTSGQSPLAIQTAWVWDNANLKFGPATLGLNTTDIDNFLGALAAKTAYIEINLTQGSDRITIYQGQITIKAVIDELNANVPVPATAYFNTDEANARFAKKRGLPGETITVISPLGGWARTIGIDDTGTRIDAIEQLS